MRFLELEGRQNRTGDFCAATWKIRERITDAEWRFGDVAVICSDAVDENAS
jgi:hypothetical protein